MSTQEIQQASDRFYQALNSVLNGDASMMEQVWSHDEQVSTLHPIGGSQSGWDAVWSGWQATASAIRNGSTDVNDLSIYLLGDVAYTIGTEHAEATIGSTGLSLTARATNVYRREGGAWKMVHHHADLDPTAARAVEALIAGQR